MNHRVILRLLVKLILIASLLFAFLPAGASLAGDETPTPAADSGQVDEPSTAQPTPLPSEAQPTEAADSGQVDEPSTTQPTPLPSEAQPTEAAPLPASEQPAAPLSAEQVGKVVSEGGYDGLLATAQGSGTVRLIVGVNQPFIPLGGLSSTQASEQQASISAAQESLLSDLNAYKLSNVSKFSYIPYVSLSVDPAALKVLLASPQVTSVEEDRPVPATLDLNWNVSRIGSPSAWGRGYTGSGWTVAILDTGVQKTHPFLSGKVVSEACYSSTGSGSGYTYSSLCPSGASSSTAANSALPYGTGVCPSGDCDHGTHVAGITAGHLSTNTLNGVAKSANILAVQVFSRFDNYSGCGGSPCALTWTSDWIKGLERVYALRSIYKIASVNMSFGGGGYTTTCDSASPSAKTAIDNLRSANIASVIASGNSWYYDSIGFPACISTAISVGATTDTDEVAYYSNSASFLSLLAPGSSIYSSIPYSSYATWDGTSMATPHVAGAWAILKQRKPTASVAQILAALQYGGKAITDARNNITKKRINVNNALNYFYPPDFNSQFNGTMTGWNKVSTVGWSVNNSTLYSLDLGRNRYASIVYSPYSYSNLDYRVRLLRTGCETCATSVYVRGTGVSAFGNWTNGYQFSITRSGKYLVALNSIARLVPIKNWTASSAIVKGSAWNVLRVVAIGSSLKFYINGILVWSGTNSAFSSGKVGIGLSTDGNANRLYVDYATLTVP